MPKRSRKQRLTPPARNRGRLAHPPGPPVTRGPKFRDTDFAGTVELVDIRAGMCVYPGKDGGRGRYLFCGAAAEGGKPYCAEHAARCYNGTARNAHRDREGEQNRRDEAPKGPTNYRIGKAAGR